MSTRLASTLKLGSNSCLANLNCKAAGHGYAANNMSPVLMVLTVIRQDNVLSLQSWIKRRQTFFSVVRHIK